MGKQADTSLTPEERKAAGRKMLGTGGAARAADAINGRKSRLDDLENEAMGTPKAQPSEGQHGQADRSKYNYDNSAPKRY